MSNQLTERENLAIGGIAAFSQSMMLHPTIYWKNAAQQGLRFTLNPFLLYRGLRVCLLNETCQMGFHFGVAGFLKKNFGTSPAGEIASALLAGVAISPWVQCCEATMIQQQRFGGTLLGTPVRLVKEFGIRGLFRGYTPMMGREVLWTTGMLGTTPLMQRWLMEEKGFNSHSAEFMASFTNGLAVGVLSCPCDAMSTVMKGDMEQKTYGSFYSTLCKRVAAGPQVFFGGVMWRSLNVAGVILIANGVRCRLEPLAIEYNKGNISTRIDLPHGRHGQQRLTTAAHCEDCMPEAECKIK